MSTQKRQIIPSASDISKSMALSLVQEVLKTENVGKDLTVDECFLDNLRSQFPEVTSGVVSPKAWLQTSDGKIYGFPYEYFRRKKNVKLTEVYKELDERRLYL